MRSCVLGCLLLVSVACTASAHADEPMVDITLRLPERIYPWRIEHNLCEVAVNRVLWLVGFSCQGETPDARLTSAINHLVWLLSLGEAHDVPQIGGTLTITHEAAP